MVFSFTLLKSIYRYYTPLMIFFAFLAKSDRLLVGCRTNTKEAVHKKVVTRSFYY